MTFKKDYAISLGHNIFKIRLRGFNRGKSSGYRLYLYCIENRNLISPITIFAKNEIEDITHEDLVLHSECVLEEINFKLGWIDR